VFPFAAKLPNIFILAVFILVIYFTVRKLFDNRVAMLSAIVTLICFSGYEFIIYPWADILYFFIIYIYIYYFAKSLVEINGDSFKEIILSGIIAGIAILQKPSAISIMPFSLFIFIFIAFSKRDKLEKKVVLKKMFLFYSLILLISSPYFIREKLLTGSFYSSEYYSFAIAKYRFSQTPNSFDSVWGFSAVPSLGSAVRHFGIFYILKDSLFQVITGIRSIFVWQDLVPFPVLFLFLGYTALFSARKQQKPERYFFMLFVLFFSYSFLIYTAYAGYEVRHLRIFIPFFIIFSVRLFFATADYIAKHTVSMTEKYGKFTFLLLISLLYFSVIAADTAKRLNQQRNSSEGLSILQGVEWIKNNTDSSHSIMTYDPSAVSFHTDRKTVRIPNLDNGDILKIAKKYNVKYIYMDQLTRSRRESFYSFCMHDSKAFRIIKQGDTEIIIITGENSGRD
jgi:4-amino-4-deoxy-L-arabinose transferase-like glycosyltransferase